MATAVANGLNYDPDANFFPTGLQKKLVEVQIGYSVLTHEEICALIINPGTGKPISKATLERVFMREIEVGIALKKANLAHAIFLQAMGAPAEYDQQGNLLVAERLPNPMLLKYLGQSQLGWNEKVEVQVNPADDLVRKTVRDEIADIYKTAVERSRNAMQIFVKEAPTIEGRAEKVNIDDGDYDATSSRESG